MTYEIKTGRVSFEVKSVDDEGVFEGYASVFGVIDQGFDEVQRGAFKKSIQDAKKNRLPILDNHNYTKQIGWDEKTLKEDDYGLLVRGRLILDIPEAKNKYLLVKNNPDENKFGISIGYRTIKAMPKKGSENVRLLQEVKLFEYSLVTFPMNIAAQVSSMKSLDIANGLMQEVWEDCYNHAKSMGASDEDFLKSMKEFKQKYMKFSIDEFKRKIDSSFDSKNIFKK